MTPDISCISLIKIGLQIPRWLTKWRPCKGMAVSQAFMFHVKWYSLLHFAVCQLLCCAFLLQLSCGTMCILCMCVCWLAVHVFVHPSRNVRLYAVNKWLSLEAPIFARAFTLGSYVRLPIFVKIANVFDLHSKGQRFQLITFRSS